MTAAYDTLKTRAEPWLAPIPGASPAGATARFDPEYQALADEVGKLDTPAGGEVNWKKVAGGATALLQRKSKDLVVAAYLGRALHATQGLDGLVTGVVLLTETMERYWDTLFPEAKRPRGRANALQWFVEKTANVLGELGPGTPEQLEGLELAARRLAQVARERLGDVCPAFGPLLDPVERLKASAAVPEAAPAAPAVAAAPAAAAASTPPQPPAFSTPAAPAGVEGAVDFLRDVGGAIRGVAALLRQADGSDPRAYRLQRVGIWLHLVAAPAATGGRTQLAPPPEGLRTQLATIAQNQRWAALLEETEAATSQHRLWLDPHRLSWQALAALGATHERARDALAAEVGALLARMPELPGLCFADGTPLADAQTRTWIEEHVRGGATAAGPPPESSAADGTAATLAEARKLLASAQAPQALALVRDEAARRGGRARFLLRLGAARLCAGAGLTAIAKSLYEELDREGRAHHLEEWEPALAAECLKGLLASARALAKDPRGSLPDLTEPYRRLCRIDPAAAHEVWP